MAVTRLDPDLCVSAVVSPVIPGNVISKVQNQSNASLIGLPVVANRSKFSCYPPLLKGTEMSLQITIDGQSEAIVRTQLAQGNARSPEALVELALQAYSGSAAKRFSFGASRKSSA